jgi:hypothetical protein
MKRLAAMLTRADLAIAGISMAAMAEVMATMAHTA